LRSGAQPAGQIAAAFPFRGRPFPNTCVNCGKPAGGGIAQWTASRLSTQLRAAQSGGCWLDQYRRFWQMNLGNLKSFVEQEYARESGEAGS
jgi:hypothetical protein